MENKKYIENLIYRTIEYPDGNSDKETIWRNSSGIQK